MKAEELNYGINEITSKVIGTVIDNNEKIKKQKKSEENKQKKIKETSKKEKDREVKSMPKKSSSKNILSYNSKQNISKKIKPTNIDQKISKLHVNLYNIEDSQKTLIPSTSILTYRKENSQEKEKTLKEDLLKITRTQKNLSIPKKTISNLEELIHNKIHKKRMKTNHKVRNRNNMFFEGLFARTFKTRTHKDLLDTDRTTGLSKRKISKKLNAAMQLPYLGDNIIFNKGETEKLLNYQYYKTSYKACCQISKFNNIPNSSMRANFRNNWEIVRDYVNNKKENEQKKINRKEKICMRLKTEN
jgi:hypothetical protein